MPERGCLKSSWIPGNEPVGDPLTLVSRQQGREDHWSRITPPPASSVPSPTQPYSLRNLLLVSIASPPLFLPLLGGSGGGVVEVRRNVGGWPAGGRGVERDHRREPAGSGAAAVEASAADASMIITRGRTPHRGDGAHREDGTPVVAIRVELLEGDLGALLEPSSLRWGRGRNRRRSSQVRGLPHPRCRLQRAARPRHRQRRGRSRSGRGHGLKPDDHGRGGHRAPARDRDRHRLRRGREHAEAG